MKLMWTLCLTWSLFYAADALQCQTCRNFTDDQCRVTESQNCSANQLCLSATVAVTGQVTLNYVAKLCVPAVTCASLGNQSFSANLGTVKGSASSFCCNTDDCNNETLSVSTQQGNNNLTCFTCDSLTDQYCNKTVKCVGSEDRCVNGSVRATATGSEINLFGCASSSVCTATSQLAEIPQLINITSIVDGPDCCVGDCCNSASILSLSIVPLLMAPLTFTLTY